MADNEKPAVISKEELERAKSHVATRQRLTEILDKNVIIYGRLELEHKRILADLQEEARRLEVVGQIEDQHYLQILNKIEANKQVIEGLKDETEQLEKQAEQLDKAAETQKNLDATTKDLVGSFLKLAGYSTKYADSMKTAFPGEEAGSFAKRLQLVAKSFGQAILSAFSFWNIIGSIISSTIQFAFAQDKAEAAFTAATGAGREYGDVINNAAGNLFEYGIDAAGAAQATASLRHSVVGFGKMTKSAQQTLVETTAQLSALGVSATDSAEIINYFTLTLNMTAEQAAATTIELEEFGKTIGVTSADMVAGYAKGLKSLGVFGKKSVKIYKKTAMAARALGMDTEELINMMKKFDTFDSAAESVAGLNAILGGSYLNTLDMVMTRDPVKRIEMLKQAIDNSNRSWEGMNELEREALALQMDMDPDELQRLMEMDSSGLREYAEDQKAMADRAMEAAGAMQKLQLIMGLIVKDLIDPLLKSFGGPDGMVKAAQSMAKEIRSFVKELVPLIKFIGSIIKFTMSWGRELIILALAWKGFQLALKARVGWDIVMKGGRAMMGLFGAEGGIVKGIRLLQYRWANMSLSISQLWTTKILPAFTGMSTFVTGTLVPRLTGAFGKLRLFMTETLVPAITGAFGKLRLFMTESFIPAITGAFGKLRLFITQSFIPAITGAFGKLRLFMTGTFIPAITGAFVQFQSFMMTSFIPTITGALIGFKSFVMTSFIPGIMSGFVRFQSFMMTSFVPRIMLALGSVRTFMMGTFVPGIMSGLVALRTFMMTSLLPAIGTIATALWTTLAPVLVAIGGAVWGLVTAIGALLLTALPVIAVVALIGGAIYGLYKIVEGLGSLVSSVFDGITSVIKGFVNILSGALNFFIKGINMISFDIPSWVPLIGGKKFGFDIPLIPKMAEGATDFSGGMAVVGEQGPELVTMGKGANVVTNENTNKIANAASKGGGMIGTQALIAALDRNTTVLRSGTGDEKGSVRSVPERKAIVNDIILYMNDREFARVVDERIDKVIQSRG